MNVTLLFLQIGEMLQGKAFHCVLASLICKSGSRAITLGSIAQVIAGDISVGHFDEGREHRADIGGVLLVARSDNFQIPTIVAGCRLELSLLIKNLCEIELRVGLR